MITHTLRSGTASAVILPYCARIAQLSFGGRDVFVSYDELEDYRGDDPYLGAGLGRTSGRIAGGLLSVDGDTYQLTVNEGADHLHGGTDGFAHRDWTVSAAAEDRLVLTLTSPDGDQGYPGAVTATITATLTAKALRIDYEAETTAPTPVSLAHHPYIRLSGDTMLDHAVEVAADAWTPLTPKGLPTGEVADVTNTPLDLREPVRMNALLGALGGEPLDHGLVCRDGVRVRITEPGGRALTVTSDHTHCQLYDAGKMGPPLRKHAGLAVEPQGWPDAERHDGFEDRILRPGETYRRHVIYAVDSGGD